MKFERGFKPYDTCPYTYSPVIVFFVLILVNQRQFIKIILNIVFQ